jgi:hypothetical protein
MPGRTLGCMALLSLENKSRASFMHAPRIVLLFTYFFWWYWGFQGLMLTKQAAYHLSHSTKPLHQRF